MPEEHILITEKEDQSSGNACLNQGQICNQNFYHMPFFSSAYNITLKIILTLNEFYGFYFLAQFYFLALF